MRACMHIYIACEVDGHMTSDGSDAQGIYIYIFVYTKHQPDSLDPFWNGTTFIWSGNDDSSLHGKGVGGWVGGQIDTPWRQLSPPFSHRAPLPQEPRGTPCYRIQPPCPPPPPLAPRAVQPRLSQGVYRIHPKLKHGAPVRPPLF